MQQRQLRAFSFPRKPKAETCDAAVEVLPKTRMVTQERRLREPDCHAENLKIDVRRALVVCNIDLL